MADNPFSDLIPDEDSPFFDLIPRSKPANPLDVPLIDPTGLIGSTEQGIDRTIQALRGSGAGQEVAQDPQSALNTFSQAGAAGALDAGLNFARLGPGLLSKALSAPRDAVTGLVNAALEQIPPQARAVAGIPQGGIASQPNPITRALQSFPTALDVPAAIKTAAEGGNFEDNRNLIQEHFFVSREQNPNAADLGDIFGDALALALTFGKPSRTIIESGGNALKAVFNKIPPSVRSTIDEVMKTGPAKATVKGLGPLARGTVRAGEAGLEGALLGILTEGDPKQLAMASAGFQAGASALRGVTGVGAITEGRFVKGGAILMANATATLAAMQFFGAPLTDDPLQPLRNIQTISDKAFFTIPAAVVATAAGYGRPNPAITGSLKAFADAMFRVRRGAVMSVVEEAQRDARIEPVVKRLVMMPNFFTPAEQRRLERAWQGDANMGDVLDDLSSDRKFVRKLNEIMGL